jgi:hypothetical protein
VRSEPSGQLLHKYGPTVTLILGEWSGAIASVVVAAVAAVAAITATASMIAVVSVRSVPVTAVVPVIARAVGAFVVGGTRAGSASTAAVVIAFSVTTWVTATASTSVSSLVATVITARGADVRFVIGRASLGSVWAWTVGTGAMTVMVAAVAVGAALALSRVFATTWSVLWPFILIMGRVLVLRGLGSCIKQRLHIDVGHDDLSSVNRANTLRPVKTLSRGSERPRELICTR